MSESTIDDRMIELAGTMSHAQIASIINLEFDDVAMTERRKAA